MSNCIYLSHETYTVAIPETVLDIPKLQDYVHRANTEGEKYSTLYGESEEAILGHMWWFLSSNVEFGHIHDGQRWVLVYFGEGRSGHTWRDFDTLVKWCFPKFIRPGASFSHVFRIADDGDPESGYLPVRTIFRAMEVLVS